MMTTCPPSPRRTDPVTTRPPFVARKHHWQHNRITASTAHAAPAEMTDPQGARHPGVALIVAGKPALVLTVDELTRVCADMIDAAEVARQ